MIFMAAESFDKIRLVSDHFTFGMLVEYLLLKVPFMITDYMPVIVLIATAIYITEISHHRELAALRAAGLTMATLLRPLLAAGITVGLLTFAIAEWVEPVSNERVEYIESVNIRGEAPKNRGVQWLRGDDSFLRLVPLRGEQFALMFLKTDTAGKWVERIDSPKAKFESGAWQLAEAYVSSPGDDRAVDVKEVKNFTLHTELSPETVAPPNAKNMRLMELYSFARALSDAGLEAREYEYQFHRKMTGAVSCLIMVVLAYTLCGNMGSRIGATSKGLLVAISLSLAFYVFGITVNILIGVGLPVAYAAWWPNIFFAGFTGYLLLKKEGY